MVSVRMSLHRAALLSRAGRSLGRRRPASVPRRLRPKLIATIFLQSVRPGQLRPESQPYFVILNEVKNLFPCEPKAADGLCRARRRKTNEVQSNICMLTIQILRRSAPQNDKTGRTAIRTTRWNQTIHCSQTPQQTGVCNWRQRGEVKGKDRCSGRSQLTEINTGFSRASRSPALRRLAKLAPLASARKQHSADRSRACELTMYALSERTDAACGARPATAEAANRRAVRLRLTQHCEL